MDMRNRYYTYKKEQFIIIYNESDPGPRVMEKFKERIFSGAE